MMVHKGHAGAGQGIPCNPLVPDEAARRTIPSARLPLVVGRLRAQDDRGALGSVQPRRLDDVEDKGVHDLAGPIGDARLRARAGAVGAAVVVGLGRAAVVVAELDDDNIAGLDLVGHGLEAALVPVGAGGAAADGAVDGGDGQQVADVIAPTVGGTVVGAAAGHGAVAEEVGGGRGPGRQLNGGGLGGRFNAEHADGQGRQGWDGELHDCETGLGAMKAEPDHYCHHGRWSCCILYQSHSLCNLPLVG